MAAAMVKKVSGEESHKACFSLKPNKAPALDGFNAIFFQKAWPIIGDQNILAVQEFFNSNQLLQELNTIIIILVPKSLTLLPWGIFAVFLVATPFIKSSLRLWLIESNVFCLPSLVMRNLPLREVVVSEIIFFLSKSFFMVTI
ncbi:hypothetical protein COP1_027756 [Malus domestica]